METILKIEANIDNMNPEDYAHVVDILLEKGAQDVWLTPIIMKKGRPAIMLSLLCDSSLRKTMEGCIFTHTRTIGLRYTNYERTICERRYRRIQCGKHQIGVKESSYDGAICEVSLEYEDILAAAKYEGVSLEEMRKRVWQVLDNSKEIKE